MSPFCNVKLGHLTIFIPEGESLVRGEIFAFEEEDLQTPDKLKEFFAYHGITEVEYIDRCDSSGDYGLDVDVHRVIREALPQQGDPHVDVS